MALGDVIALVLAGALAGLVGTAGGITSLVSYPALLAVGLGPLAASVANLVALVACWPAAAMASRAELAGRGAWVARWSLVAAAGGAAGSALLLATPPGDFERLVPVLVALGSVALLLEPWLTARRAAAGGGAAGRIALPAGMLPLGLYNGYFGAGSGVLTLALLLLLVDGRLPQANALKNMLIGAGAVASALTFVLATSVRWSAVVPLGLGMLVGASLGPRVARRVPAGVLRLAIAALGLGLAVQLACAAWS